MGFTSYRFTLRTDRSRRKGRTKIVLHPTTHTIYGAPAYKTHGILKTQHEIICDLIPASAYQSHPTIAVHIACRATFDSYHIEFLLHRS